MELSPSYKRCLCMVLVLYVFLASSLGGNLDTRQEILRNLLYNKSGNTSLYEHRIPPLFDKDDATNVSVQIYLMSFDSVTEAAMEFSVSLFLRETWTDSRLAWWHPDFDDHLEVHSEMMKDIWVPDLYFINEKKAVMHEMTVSNKLLHISPSGVVRHSLRVSMTLSCDMYLDRYPHDEQMCFISLGSYSYSQRNVALEWDSTPVIIRTGVTLPRFQISFDQVVKCHLLLSEASMIDGTYSCIQANFILKREFGYYIVQVYVPSVLIVILSWVSFWIDFDAIPARVSLGLLTVLTMTTQSTGEKAVLPPVSYLKAIDVWMSTCLFFVFAALLEFAYVNVQSRVQKRRLRSGVVGREQANNSHGVTTNLGNPDNNEKTERTCISFLRCRTNLENARLADKTARVVFPLAFLLFNAFYWTYYR